MDILIVGRWVMLVIGALILLAAIWSIIKRPEIKRPLMLLLGVFILGIGVFGLEFVPAYRQWIEVLKDMVNNPSEKSFSVFFEETSKENMPVELREIGINFATTHPIDRMEEILEEAIKRTPDNKESGKSALKYAKRSLQGNQLAVDRILRSTPAVDEVEKFDPVTRKLIYQRLIKDPQYASRKYRIDPSSIQQYRPTLKPFPGRTKKD